MCIWNNRIKFLQDHLRMRINEMLCLLKTLCLYIFIYVWPEKFNLSFFSCIQIFFWLQRGGKDTSQSEESEGSVVDSEAESVAESRVTRRSAAGKKFRTVNWKQKRPSPRGIKCQHSEVNWLASLPLSLRYM